MRPTWRLRVPALAAAMALALLISSLPASAAGPKRIFITKTNEKLEAFPGVTFELYEDTNGNGVRDEGEPKLQTKVTDNAGKATFDPVNPGKYIVHEVTPAGYVDNEDKPVEIPNAKGKGPEIVFTNTKKPANHRVNDPGEDASVDDGTHVSDFGPSIATLCDADEDAGCDTLAAWNDSAELHTPGGPSAVAAALSPNLGSTWDPQLKMFTSSFAALLGDPAVAADPTRNRFFVASLGFRIAGAFDRAPIAVSTLDGSGFSAPVDTFPEIDPSWFAHGPSLAVDQGGPRGGDAYLVYTLSLGPGQSEIASQSSTDGGNTWSVPFSVSGGTGTYDGSGVTVAPNSNIYVTWIDYQGSGDAYDIWLRRSTNGGEDFDEAVALRMNVPKTGTSGTCAGAPSRRTVLGSIGVSDEPQIVVNPANSLELFAVYSGHGQGADEGDVFYSTSTDGGDTWRPQERLGNGVGTQWGVRTGVSPDGRLAFAWWQSLDNSTAAPVVLYYNPFEHDELGEPRNLAPPFPIWGLEPSFDTNVVNCGGFGDLAAIAPGSGFLFAWTDGRDPGPAGNSGIDPNIYFAHDIGPFLDTSLSLAVAKTRRELEARGRVSPPPALGARVTVTLFRDDGGGFDRIGRQRDRLDADGSYSVSFDRPGGGRCRITVTFGGSEGRAPSVPRSKTFAC